LVLRVRQVRVVSRVRPVKPDQPDSPVHQVILDRLELQDNRGQEEHLDRLVQPEQLASKVPLEYRVPPDHRDRSE
jgi:hypothetical protein